MRSATISFLIGIICLQHFSHLPTVKWIGAIISAAFCMRLLFPNWWNILRLPMMSMLGFAWCLLYATMQSAWFLPEALEGVPVRVTGYIASLPNREQFGTSFQYAIKSLENKPAHGFIRLLWNNSNTNLQVGDQWQLIVRLKKTVGTMNPGGFDYEAYAFQAGIRANGYVLNQTENKLLSSHWYHYPLDRIRQYFKSKISQNLPQSSTSPWILALSIGERHNISETDWQVLRNTGTNHLMAIAGLHIGLMAALAHFIVVAIWRRISRLTLKIPAMHAGAIAALVMALTYSAMAGFSIPTQRACLMLSIFLGALLLRRHIAVWQAWCVALLVVLLLNPLSVLTESFWLSFGTVALIIYGVGGRLSPTGLWWKWGRTQWVIAVGLLPFSIWLFGQFSLIAFVANSIAIPWVGFLVVPLCVIGCAVLLFSAKMGGVILWLADKILSVLWVILEWLSHLHGIVWYQHVPQNWMLFAAIIGMIFLLMPVGLPGRYLGVIWLLPLMLFKPNGPKPGDVWLTLLDVGQGLSAVVQTEQHILVFDAGPRLSTSYDMGDSVVVPFLHTLAAKKIDMLVVSHGDNDHIGGANAILNQFPVLSIKTSVPELLPNAAYCLRGIAWQWDGVNFAFLHPTPEQLDLDNNSSCVLRVTSGDKSILLTGDIEKFAERELVMHTKENLQADILIAPHHGSKTSALDDFIHYVNPHYVLFSVGYRNRYHFPHPSVMKKYHDLSVLSYETVQTGAIQFSVVSNMILLPNLFRNQHNHYWSNE